MFRVKGKHLEFEHIGDRAKDLPDHVQPHVWYDAMDKKWVLGDDWCFRNEDADYEVHIPGGFRFDLASVPRWLWPFIGAHELSIEAPAVHDFIYMRAGVLAEGEVVPLRQFRRRETDFLFRMIMKTCGVGARKRTVAWLAVRAFGWIPWLRYRKKLRKAS
jgi:hypothetical protein